MIWHFIARKKHQRHLQLITLLYKKSYSVTELARQTKVSSKTIRRDLTELRQKNYVIKRKYWMINYHQKLEFSELYQKLIMEDPRFYLFQQYLWKRGPKEISYSRLKELNKSLLHFNLSANIRAKRFIGDPALILHLQLHYLRDFSKFNDETELYHQLDRYYKKGDLVPLKKELFPEPSELTAFTQKFNLNATLGAFFFLDYLRHDYQGRLEFYQHHKKYQTVLYHETLESLTAFEPKVVWKNESAKEIFTIKLFDFLLGIHQGLPIAVFNLHWKREATAEIFYFIGKEMKRSLPLLQNCRLDELAFALKNILSSCYHTSSLLDNNLKFFSLIDDKDDSYLLSEDVN